MYLTYWRNRYVNLQKIAALGPWGIWAVLPIELLHGITFAINWSALTAHATRVAPPGFASAMQQLMTAGRPWEDGSSDNSYMFRWRCRVCRHLSYLSVVRCGCAADGYLCLKHG